MYTYTRANIPFAALNTFLNMCDTSGFADIKGIFCRLGVPYTPSSTVESKKINNSLSVNPKKSKLNVLGCC